MRRLMVFGLCLLMSALFMAFMPMPAAEAEGWEWRQDDWSGGPGQDSWFDSSRYSESNRMDTMSVPGTIRLSYIINPLSRDASNPVLSTGGTGTFDDAYVMGYPRRREEGGYEVLYEGWDATFTAIGYASSSNGIDWSKYAGNPVLERSGPSAWDASQISTGPIVDEGDHYTMFFRGWDSGGVARYGFATSPDLKTWDRNTDFVFGPGAAGSWEQWLSEIDVAHKGSGYVMWYAGNNPGIDCGVGYATSPDGISWTRHAANPVITADAWSSGGINGLQVLERPWMGDYLMVYSADNGAGNFGIGTATSTDGITWIKDSANPVIGVAPSPWYQHGIKLVDLTFDGSIYKMALNGTDLAGLNMGQAYSEDGTSWNVPDAPLNPILTPSTPGSWEDGAVRATLPFLEGDKLRAFYTGIGSGVPTAAIGTATSAPDYSSSGMLFSSVFDVGQPATWGDITWDEMAPAGTSVVVYVRTGDVPVPDGTWSGWTAVADGNAVPGSPMRYIQYAVLMNGTGSKTPVVSNLAIDFTAIPSTWYFAEGYTGSGFDEWITIQNPNGAAAHVLVTYYTPSGILELRNHTVPANSRYNIYVNSDLGEGLDNSFKVESDQPIICERPMYFRYVPGFRDWCGGSDAMGSTQLSRQWYFAEGCTAASFDEYITIQNPNDSWATVDVTYFVNGGKPIEKQHRIRPSSRYTILVDEDAGPGLEVSAKLEADQPILAERPMYFNLGGMDGGHIVMGSAYLARDWYLAEGATYDPFTEYITIQNPNDAPATVDIEYYTPSTTPIPTTHTIAANSRFTLNARSDSGVDSEVSTYVHSNQPILVERPMYFNMLNGGLVGGHCATGVNSPSREWSFGEGYTGPGFDTFITVQNPGGTVANLTVTYYLISAGPIIRTHTVGPHSRYTIGMGVDALVGYEMSTYVSSDQPVICERPMYFFYQGYHAYNWAGGHDSQGFAP